jgi:hypothetical protein
VTNLQRDTCWTLGRAPAEHFARCASSEKLANGQPGAASHLHQNEGSCPCRNRAAARVRVAGQGWPALREKGPGTQRAGPPLRHRTEQEQHDSATGRAGKRAGQGRAAVAGTAGVHIFKQ